MQKEKTNNIVVKLKEWKCTFLGDSSEKCINEALYEPTAMRLKLLHWLCQRFESPGNFVSFNDDTEDKIKGALMTKLINLGICKNTTSKEFVEGKMDVEQQAKIWTLILELIVLLKEPKTQPEEKSAIKFLEKLTSDIFKKDGFLNGTELFSDDMKHYIKMAEKEPVLTHQQVAVKYNKVKERNEKLTSTFSTELDERQIYFSQLQNNLVELKTETALHDASNLTFNMPILETKVDSGLNKSLVELSTSLTSYSEVIDAKGRIVESMENLKRSFCDETKSSRLKITELENIIYKK